MPKAEDVLSTFKGYGYATLPDGKATADTQYFTGSTTKAFTAAAAALLVQDERYPDVQWTSPISDFIRGDFVLEDEHATTHTTIEDALSHRSGLPRHDLIYGQANDTPSLVVQRIRYLPLTAEPRTVWQYCNIMFGVMTDLLETVMGIELEQILHDRFWKPLGMLSTSFTIPSTDSAGSRLARGYYWHAQSELDNPSTRKGSYVPEPYIDIFPISGAGATISTVNDYALWAKAWLDVADASKPANKSSPITKRMFRDLVTPRSVISDYSDDVDELDFITPPGYALGWITTKVLGETLVAHDGGLTGFGTGLYLIPAKGYAIASMGNTAITSNIVSSIVTSRLLIQKLGFGALQEASIAEVQNRLRAVSQVPLPSSDRPPRRPSKELKKNLQTSSLPLPGSIADFAGLYDHPAYGSINLTVASDKVLEGIFYPRTWPTKIRLSHTTDTVFAVDVFSPHGLGDIATGESVVWTGDGIIWENDEEASQAVFKFGLDGEVVETMGIELEESMVELARSKGPKFWKEGMIWFTKA